MGRVSSSVVWSTGEVYQLLVLNLSFLNPRLFLFFTWWSMIHVDFRCSPRTVSEPSHTKAHKTLIQSSIPYIQLASILTAWDNCTHLAPPVPSWMLANPAFEILFDS